MPRSLVKQVNDALDRLLRIGESRHEAKRRGDAERWIFSYRTRGTYGGHAITAVKWIREHHRPDLRELRQLTPADLQAYIRHCEAQGLAGGTIRSRIAALHKLEHGMRALRWWDQPAPLATGLTTSTPRSRPRMGFSERQADAILAQLSPEAALVARLQLTSGLRIQEIARLREEDLDRERGTIRVVSGKGGRDRLVTRLLDPAILEQLPTGRHWLWESPGSLVRRTQAEIARVRDRLGIAAGTGRNSHSFRAAYAERFLRRALADGLDENRARDALALQLGHNRRSITYRYCPRLTPRA